MLITPQVAKRLVLTGKASIGGRFLEHGKTYALVIRKDTGSIDRFFVGQGDKRASK